jgi:TRAP-type mannitol/chloroaromatic compound transport system permease small subunit
MNQAAGQFICFGVPLLGVLILFEVVKRYVFNSPTVWIHDISQFLLGAVYMLGAGYTLMLRKHVNMDMLYSRLSVRGRALCDVLTGLLVLVFLGVLSWYSFVMAWESILFREVLTQSVFEPPLYPIKTIFFLGCILFMLQALAQFLRDLTTLVSGSETTPDSDTPGK